MRVVASLGALVVVLFIGCDSGAPVTAEDQNAETPNIVLLIGDDHGWPYSGFMGSEIVRTPHLDRLASEGTVFPYGFTSSSQCRPSLNTLLTGLHPIQWNERISELRRRGIRRSENDAILDFVTLPRLLAERGYASLQAGKYWEGTYDMGGFTHGTKDSMGKEVIERWGWVQAEAGGDGLEVGRSTMQPLWDFLDAHGDARFFVWFAPKLPHTPHDAGPEWLQVYPKESLSKSARRYYANVTRLDARVGEILAYLDRTGLRKKTLLVYLSDNGWEQGPHENPDPRLGGPKGKWSIYELGFRTPVIFSWPGRIEAGRVRDDLVAAVDVFTTLVAFAGLDRPKNRYGIDLRPMLLGDAPPTRTRVVGNMEALRPPENSTFGMGKTAFVRPERAYFLRDRSWRYIWYRDAGKYVDRSEEELYRIDRDPMETRNVIAEFPAVAANFRNEILLWLDEMKRPFR